MSLETLRWLRSLEHLILKFLRGLALLVIDSDTLLLKWCLSSVIGIFRVRRCDKPLSSKLLYKFGLDALQNLWEAAALDYPIGLRVRKLHPRSEFSHLRREVYKVFVTRSTGPACVRSLAKHSTLRCIPYRDLLISCLWSEAKTRELLNNELPKLLADPLLPQEVYLHLSELLQLDMDDSHLVMKEINKGGFHLLDMRQIGL